MPLLTPGEALDVSDSFLQCLYGEEIFMRWRELKLEMSFVTERDYVSWLMDVARECNRLDDCGGGGVRGDMDEGWADTNIYESNVNERRLNPYINDGNVIERQMHRNIIEEEVYKGQMGRDNTEDNVNEEQVNANIIEGNVKATEEARAPSADVLNPSSSESATIPYDIDESQELLNDSAGSDSDESRFEGADIAESQTSGTGAGASAEISGSDRNTLLSLQHQYVSVISDTGVHDNDEGVEQQATKLTDASDSQKMVDQSQRIDNEVDMLGLEDSTDAVLSYNGSDGIVSSRGSSVVGSSSMSMVPTPPMRSVVAGGKTPLLRHVCPYCPYRARTRTHLRSHCITRHGYASKYQCSRCGKYFPAQSKLNAHGLCRATAQDSNPAASSAVEYNTAALAYSPFVSKSCESSPATANNAPESSLAIFEHSPFLSKEYTSSPAAANNALEYSPSAAHGSSTPPGIDPSSPAIDHDPCPATLESSPAPGPDAGTNSTSCSSAPSPDVN